MTSRKIGLATLGAVSLLGISAPEAAIASTCAIYPGTNEITIKPGHPVNQITDPIVIPATPGGLVGVCVDATGDPNPQAAQPVVDVGVGCGIPCFVVSWDGVSTAPVVVTITVYVNGNPTTSSHTIGGGSLGSFCINAGMPCP